MENVPCSQVQLFISCKNLKSEDVLSASDPLCHLSMYDSVQGEWHSEGSTERITNDSNPTFSKTFTIDYFFEQDQKLCFEIYDVDSDSVELKDHDPVGKLETSVADVVMSRGGFQGTLHKANQESSGEIHVRCEEVSGRNAGHVHFELAAQKLPKMDLMGSIDPYLVISRANEDSTFSKVHSTEVVKKSKAPRWKPFVLSTTTLCNNDFYRPILIEVFDWDKNSDDDKVGELRTSVDALLQNRGDTSFTESEDSSSTVGNLVIKHVHFSEEKSFVDYLSSGWELSMVVGVDFTGSNGNPSDPESLHYLSSERNQYESAISSVGEILQHYDADKMFPAFGFGAKLPNGQVSHCFPLNGTNDPYCNGINGILESYRNAMSNVQLWGPTMFSPIIREAAAKARQNASQNKYYLLLMITDGVITDMSETIEEIVNASSLPLSIIIVGVGNEDFSKMEALDGDDGKLKSKGKTAHRDIVQFVEFNKYRGKSNALLARDTLKELPSQFLNYASQNK
eukprot:gb/GECH01013165.1/.p1 GENE.gb/GECH01013165.1/~~gb/GECH01013165.1/.p1  ORF type:complete len:510 (+),score=138.88 gb/GECH01013165.1/:1-1530(+)